MQATSIAVAVIVLGFISNADVFNLLTEGDMS